MLGPKSEHSYVLILSAGSDSSTSSVIEWLLHFGIKFYRINYLEDDLRFLSSDLENTWIEVNGEPVNLKYFTAFWYRKGVLRLTNDRNNYTGSVNRRLELHLNRERDDLISFVYNEFARKKRAFTTADTADVNKLEVLKTAKLYGIDVPDSIVATNKSMLVEAIEKHAVVITKPLSGYHLTVPLSGKRYMTFTKKISTSNLEAIPEAFLPSLVQRYVPKKYEIRSFYLLGDFYSMAIFSQQVAQTSTDFRKYSREQPNRTVPFQLPSEIEKNLEKLMRALGLHTGSIDLIYTPEGEFYFLEVNPVGQFGMVSYPCNYGLEKVIANHLIAKG
jgi:ATP-GRASP peptide maturase of grasp-with-spasm system